jgi:hypothetical protein
VVPITITGGDSVVRDNKAFRVPKRDLVSTVQVLLQGGRLKIAPALAESALLVQELQNFQVKISDLGHDSYGAWREGTHDDLVLAAALACWHAERVPKPRAFTALVGGSRSLVDGYRSFS